MRASHLHYYRSSVTNVGHMGIDGLCTGLCLSLLLTPIFYSVIKRSLVSVCSGYSFYIMKVMLSALFVEIDMHNNGSLHMTESYTDNIRLLPGTVYDRDGNQSAAIFALFPPFFMRFIINLKSRSREYQSLFALSYDN